MAVATAEHFLLANAAAALLLYAASLALFWSAIHVNRHHPLTLAFSDDVPEHLVSQGPYRWIRHPFYVSYSIAWAAGAVVTRSIALLPTVLVMFAIYYRAAVGEETKFQKGLLAAEHSAYRRSTGMFFPKLRRA